MIPWDYEKPKKHKCYDTLVPKIFKVTQTAKTIPEIKDALGYPQHFNQIDETVKWLEENGRLNVGPDKNKHETYIRR